MAAGLEQLVDIAQADLATGGACAMFAVLDGAQFDNLPNTLLLEGFRSQPLYLDRGDNDPERVITAPHLVWLDQRDEDRDPALVIPALIAVLTAPSAAVFWHCPEGSEVLYRHLRGLNMVLYPQSALPPAEEADSDTTAQDSHVAVLFRHADANVMAQILPAITAPEALRLFGPADRVIIQPTEDWSPDNAPIDVAPPAREPDLRRDMLRLSEATAQRLDALRQKRRDRRVAAYLRRVAPEQSAQISDADLLTYANGWNTEAEGFGVTSEAALGRWSYMQLLTGGTLGQKPEVQQFMTVHDPTMSPDQRVRALLRASADAIGGMDP